MQKKEPVRSLGMAVILMLLIRLYCKGAFRALRSRRDHARGINRKEERIRAFPEALVYDRRKAAFYDRRI